MALSTARFLTLALGFLITLGLVSIALNGFMTSNSSWRAIYSVLSLTTRFGANLVPDPGVSLSELVLCREPNKYLACQPPHEKCEDGCIEPGDDQPTPFSFSESTSIIDIYFKLQPSRLVVLDTYLRKENLTDTVFVLFLNRGYLYLFLNFLCSLEANEVKYYLENAIVLVSDEVTNKVLTSRKIRTYNVTGYMHSWWQGNGVIRLEAARNFGQGSHSRINILAQAFANDILQTGRPVALMDVDFVWKKHALKGIEKIAKDEDRDAVFLSDGRVDSQVVKESLMSQHDEVYGKFYRTKAEDEHGFTKYNTGFFLVRPTKWGKKLFATAMRMFPLMRWKGCDQPQWNSILHHRRFVNVSIGLLPVQDYIPGGAWSSDGRTKGEFRRVSRSFPVNMTLAHASDVARHLRKVTKLDAVNLWYLQNTCSYFPACMAIGNGGGNQMFSISSAFGCMPDNMDELLVNTDVSNVLPLNSSLNSSLDSLT